MKDSTYWLVAIAIYSVLMIVSLLLQFVVAPIISGGFIILWFVLAMKSRHKEQKQNVGSKEYDATLAKGEEKSC